MRVGTRALATLACGATLVAVSACATEPGGSSAGCSGVYANYDPALPDETLNDWVAHGSQVSVVRVTAEHDIPNTGDPADPYSGAYVGRSLDVTIVRNLWTAPGVKPVTSLSFTDVGWSVKDGGRTPIVRKGFARLAVGDEAIVPLALVDGEAQVMSGPGIIPVQDGRAQAPACDDYPAARQLDGHTPDEVAGIFVRLTSG